MSSFRKVGIATVQLTVETTCKKRFRVFLSTEEGGFAIMNWAGGGRT